MSKNLTDSERQGIVVLYLASETELDKNGNRRELEAHFEDTEGNPLPKDFGVPQEFTQDGITYYFSKLLEDYRPKQ